MKIKEWIESKINNYHFLLAIRIAEETSQAVLSSILCNLGIEELEKIVEQAKKNKNKEGLGHCDYANLAKLLGTIINERKRNGLIGTGCRVCGCPNHDKKSLL